MKNKNLINDDDINKLEELYKDLDPNLNNSLKSISSQLKEANKAQKEKDEVLEDEKETAILEKRIGNCFENHKKALIAYMSNPANEATNRGCPSLCSYGGAVYKNGTHGHEHNSTAEGVQPRQLPGGHDAGRPIRRGA